MRRVLEIFILLYSIVTLHAQEICDNGIDDNGNGLIDLNDPACICTGFPAFSDKTNKIPNPDFEEMACCPMTFSEVACAAPWTNGNGATVDYNHTCGFHQPELWNSSLIPFASGQGVLGTLINNNLKEYPAVCLNSVFEAGTQYILRFHIGAVPVGPTCSLSINQFSPIDITLYGNTTCNMVSGTHQCPIIFGSTWEVIGTVLYAPIDHWTIVDIVFTPLVDLYGIMIGSPCTLPPEYAYPCWVYIVYDNLKLLEDNENDPAELLINTRGESCSNDYYIYGSVNHFGGIWQWYFDGIAISGENEFKLYLANNQFQSGLYTARYSTPDGCITEEIYIDLPPRDTTVYELLFCHGDTVICSGEEFNTPGTYEIILENYLGCDSVIQCILTHHPISPITIHEHLFCPGETIICSGQEFETPGTYEIILENYLGCDSLIQCVLSHYPISPTTFIQIDTCGPVEIEICSAFYSTSGYYTRNCPDQNGCDSTVLLDLRILNPIAIIDPPDTLPCSPNAEIVLNGSNSPLNPFSPANTFYSWSSGPNGGFNSPTDGPQVIITRPGEYCLNITHEHNGFSCSHSDCVVVEVDGSIPETPKLTGPFSSCPDTILTFTLTNDGDVPITGYSWIVPDTSLSVFLNDSTLRYNITDLDSILICGFTVNECGRSDTTCLLVLPKPVSITSFDSFVCDSSLVGILIDSLVNQFGCDSIIIHNKEFAPSHVFLLTESTCDPNLVSTDTLVGKNQFGCDSIVIKNTTLLRSDSIHLTLFSCDSLLSGVDTFHLFNSFGCDSLVIIDTRFVNNYQTETFMLICSEGTPFIDTLIISSGPCDSIFITHYNYKVPDSSFLFSNTCDPTQEGVFIDVLIDIYGCDSTIIHTVSLFASDTIINARITCDPFDISRDTLFFVNHNGCDSIVIINPLFAGIDTLFRESFSCDSGQIGVQFFVLPGTPCDTPVVLTTHYTPSIEEALFFISCDSIGPLTDTSFFTSTAGCDSIVVRHFSYSHLNGQVHVDPERCLGYQDGSLRFIHTSGGSSPFLFQLNSGVWQSNPVFNNLPPGVYSLLVRDSIGCIWNYPGLIVASGQDFYIDAGSDRDVKLGEVVSLNATSSHLINQLTWAAIDPIDCITCPNALLGPISTSQTVLLSALSDNGCPASDEVVFSLRYASVPEVFIPTSFSPNRDGINDYFTVFGNDQVLMVRNLSIYDRWGEALYSQDNLPINNPNVGWDGTFRNALMIPAVFIYVAEIEFVDGAVKLYKGEVTLLR
jgi:gliding motility-associated-like protein